MSQKSIDSVVRTAILAALLCLPDMAAAGGIQRVAVRGAPSGTAVISAVPDFRRAAVRIPKSFLGISVEYGGSLDVLFGKSRLAITARLLNGLGRLQGSPVLRIGGNSEDSAVWNLPALHPRPAGDTINLTSRVAKMLRAAAVRTGGKLILGVNFGRGTSTMAKAWISAAIRDIGARHILAFEIGNEPDLYNHNDMRPHSYTVRDYFRQWNAFADKIQSHLPQRRMLAGPAFCASWRKYTTDFIKQQHSRLSVVTMHEYPLGAPIKNRHSPRYASVDNLLKNSSSAIFAKLIRAVVPVGRGYEIPVRFAEINSAYGGGKTGVSNVFAASLWSLDTLFEVAASGSAGVNFHTGPRYGAFWSFHRKGIRVLPVYYGMLMFAQAAPAGSRLIPISLHTKANINAWMTLDQHGVARVVLINKELHHEVMVKLKLPSSQKGQLERLTGISIFSQKRISIGGQTFDDSQNGMLKGHRQVTVVPAKHSIFAITLKHASAALMTVRLNR